MDMSQFNPTNFNNHYYILCLFAKGQTKNLKVLRKKKKKREGFAKEKKTCQVCDAEGIATYGATVIANL
jgi:hypothetical protein